MNRSTAGVIAAILLAAAFYWASALSFIPVPWPDDSAFFLPALDWIRWPPAYRMHAQAAFVPSYDLANFNTMPFLPLLLGLGNLAGIHSSHAIRVFGMAAMAAWASLLAIWMSGRGARAAWIWVIALGAMLSPAVRWGAMVVRPEIWEGLLWLLMLMELDGFFATAGRANRWRLPGFLALAAYVHFQGIIWVPAVAAALLLAPAPENAGATGPRGARSTAFSRLFGVGWRTAALLLPWFLYVIAHWGVFWSQMGTQFGRLGVPHPYLGSLYGWFHYLFISNGSPASYPKFFNLGKGLTWLALLGGAAHHLLRARRDPATRGVRVAAVLAVFGGLYLWGTKPETWFTVLVHVSLWPLLALAVIHAKPRHPGWLVAAALLVLLEGAATAQQYAKIRGVYTWERYHSWVNCIEAAIGPRQRIWQPHVPDALVELAGRAPGRDYTRAVDFDGISPLLDALAGRSEVIIHSGNFGPELPEARQEHTGAAREFDRNYLATWPWLPFKDYSALKLPGRDLQICHRGPFWAALTLTPVAGDATK